MFLKYLSVSVLGLCCIFGAVQISDAAPQKLYVAATSGDDLTDGTLNNNPSDELHPLDSPMEVLRDVAALPEPVQRMRQLIIDAARSGDIEKLRPLLGNATSGTQISFDGAPTDPIDFLRSQSGEENGYEILAILLEVIESGFVHVRGDGQEDVYVWPYYYGLSLEELTPEQNVELFTLVTASDYEGMKEYGVYNFYRLGITPDGEWVFFVAGD